MGKLGHYPPVRVIGIQSVAATPYYHSLDDAFDKVDFDKVAIVVGGVRQVVETLAEL